MVPTRFLLPKSISINIINYSIDYLYKHMLKCMYYKCVKLRKMKNGTVFTGKLECK